MNRLVCCCELLSSLHAFTGRHCIYYCRWTNSLLHTFHTIRCIVHCIHWRYCIQYCHWTNSVYCRHSIPYIYIYVVHWTNSLCCRHCIHTLTAFTSWGHMHSDCSVPSECHSLLSLIKHFCYIAYVHCIHWGYCIHCNNAVVGTIDLLACKSFVALFGIMTVIHTSEISFRGKC